MSTGKKHFYHQIIEIDSLFIEMDDLEFNEEEKKHLSDLQYERRFISKHSC